MVYPNRIHKSLTSSRVHRQGRVDRLTSFMSPAASTNQANSEVNDVDIDAVYTVPLAHVNVETIPAGQGFDEGLEHDQFLNSGIPDDFEKRSRMEEIAYVKEIILASAAEPTVTEEDTDEAQIYQDPDTKDVLIPEHPFNNDEYDTSIQKKKFYAQEAGLAMIKRRLQIDFVREYEICSKKGCYLFDPIIDVNMAACPQCGAVRRATSVVKMVDIGDHLVCMLTCNDFRKEVEQYREFIDAIGEDDPYTDFFSGLAFKELKAKGLFSGKHDLAIVLR
ncbi:hypothetical protein INT47_012816 [Mucor saturninus]|uniref:Uncharacterized protein n=1 Tax=Mucor saturninus TaxID=64648 RepID=A0A8H7URL3_9FUNG|nr:hypothetical protein INT47_012816 [Mucor saturninus]